MKTTLALLALAGGVSALALGGCTDKNSPPDERNTCYQVVEQPNGAAPKFNVVATKQPSVEHCAAQLDTIRYRFMALGSTRTSITGAYNGTFLFIDTDGMFTANSLKGGRFGNAARTDDGRLTISASIPQPGPQAHGIVVSTDPAIQELVRKAKLRAPAKK